MIWTKSNTNHFNFYYKLLEFCKLQNGDHTKRLQWWRQRTTTNEQTNKNFIIQTYKWKIFYMNAWWYDIRIRIIIRWTFLQFRFFLFWSCFLYRYLFFSFLFILFDIADAAHSVHIWIRISVFFGWYCVWLCAQIFYIVQRTLHNL